MRKLSVVTLVVIIAALLWSTEKIKSPSLSTLSNGSESPQLPVIDLKQTLSKYQGFGIGIHAGDIIYPRAFDELKPDYVRMEFGPVWDDVAEKIPSQVSVEEMLAYITRNYNGDAYDRLLGAQGSHQFLRKRGIKIIKIQFDLPYHWRSKDEQSQLLSQHIEDLARFYTAHLLFLRQNGVEIDYFELANEPDGFWNGHISPEDYTRLLKHFHSLAQQYGLENIQTIGPGLTFLNLHNWSPPYFEALKKDGAQYIDIWSTHTWDEVEFRSSRPEYTYGIWQPFLDQLNAIDPQREKPLFVTEYASDITHYGEKEWPSPRDQIAETTVDTWPYAVRVIANSITHLNRGANALIVYRLSNSHWHETGWGIIQPEDPKDFTAKPIYTALVEFLSNLPLGADTLEPLWYQHDDTITFSCFHAPKKQNCTLLLTNTTQTAQSKTIQFTNAAGHARITEQKCLTENGAIALNTSCDNTKNEIHFELPPQSIARVTLAFSP